MHFFRKVLICLVLILQGNKIFAKKLTSPSCQQKWGIKIGRECCINQPISIFGCPNEVVSGSGCPVGIFWEPCRKNSSPNKSKNKLEPEIGLFFLCKHLTGNRKDVLYNTTKKNLILDRGDSVQFNVYSLMLPIGMKYYPGEKKRFAIHAGFLVTYLIHASKKGDIIGYLEESTDYQLLKEQPMGPFSLALNEPSEITNVRNTFLAEWENHKDKVQSIPTSKVADHLFGFGFEIGFEYETEIGFIFNIPHFRFIQHPGNCSIVVGLGYNIGKCISVRS